MKDISICIKGAGEMASAVAWRLYMANMRRIFMLECSEPLAVRRNVSFSEVVYDAAFEVENVEAALCHVAGDISKCWRKKKIAVLVDPDWHMPKAIQPDVVVDAILAKKNLGTEMTEAPLVIGLGPGFTAGTDVHMVVETNRGHNLGRIILSGSAEPNTGIPGVISGYAEERVLRAPGNGRFNPAKEIGERVVEGETVGEVNGITVPARINGVLRGLIRPGSKVREGLKIGDIDPRGEKDYCYTISDKARAISGSVLEAILRVYPSCSA